jgi:hypothetical protein
MCGKFVSKVEIARFSRLFWLGGLRKGAEVELSSTLALFD